MSNSLVRQRRRYQAMVSLRHWHNAGRERVTLRQIAAGMMIQPSSFLRDIMHDLVIRKFVTRTEGSDRFSDTAHYYTLTRPGHLALQYCSFIQAIPDEMDVHRVIFLEGA